MRIDILRLANELARRGEPFALATVVRREPPSSAQLGDKALVTSGGAFHGWLGGSCTRPSVTRVALEVLETGVPRLISLVPDPAMDRRPGITLIPMTCHSGGSVDIYIEPVLAARRLIIFGSSGVAHALTRLASVLGYTVEVADPDADAATLPEAEHVWTDPDRLGDSSHAPGSFVVIATHGERDEAAIRGALALDPAYIGLVSSRARFEQLREILTATGTTEAQLDRVKAPAGLDIGCTTPEEIALSILAEIVEVSGEPASLSTAESAAPSPPTAAVDPVCGMTVPIDLAEFSAEFHDETYYFCCGHCRERFIADAPSYLGTPSGGDA